MTLEALKEELEFFYEKKQELLKMHPGQFALIKGRTLVGVFPTREEAYAEGVRRYIQEPFLIQKIVDHEDPEQVPLLAYLIRRAII